MKIKLKINGRDAPPDNLGTAVEDAVFATVKEQIAQKLSNLRCPEHHQSPKFEFQGDSVKNLKAQIRPCCEWMREEAARVLNQK